jgi:hypothetical protein
MLLREAIKSPLSSRFFLENPGLPKPGSFDLTIRGRALAKGSRWRKRGMSVPTNERGMQEDASGDVKTQTRLVDCLFRYFGTGLNN